MTLTFNKRKTMSNMKNMQHKMGQGIRCTYVLCKCWAVILITFA
jgi:hypothetical protein